MKRILASIADLRAQASEPFWPAFSLLVTIVVVLPFAVAVVGKATA